MVWVKKLLEIPVEGMAGPGREGSGCWLLEEYFH
jgi:hypothetical protein